MWSEYNGMNFGGPGKRAEFMMSEMKPDMDKIQMIEDSVPMPAALGKSKLG